MLDKHYLTEQVIPLLAKIKTREPGVLIASLAVFELLGNKCDVEACKPIGIYFL
jgi:SCY1-like protein 2